MQDILPPEIINTSIEAHYLKFSKKTNIIYLLAILLFVIACLSIFIFKFEITVMSRGMIRSSSEPVSITSPVIAKVIKTSLIENKFVSCGDTLLWLNKEKYSEKIEHLKSMVNKNKTCLNDIDLLFTSQFTDLKTDLFNAAGDEYKQKLAGLDLNIRILQKSFNRSLSLYKKGVIPLIEKEESEYKLKNKIEQRRDFIKQTRNTWQRMAEEYRQANANNLNEIKVLREDIEDHYILAPASGYISEYKGVKSGSFVTSGSVIAVISPGDTLITEHFVPPGDIGYLHPGMPVTYQVDPYNYNEWGLATGKITDISKEVTIINDQPYFKVHCDINETHLSLKNGFKGELKKGLTTTSRFKIIKRSLAQLMFDKTDNWLNPNTFQK